MPKYKKIKVQFYCKGFREIELHVSEGLCQLSEGDRRFHVSKIIAEFLYKHGLRWDRSDNDFLHNDSFGIRIITAKYI